MYGKLWIVDLVDLNGKGLILIQKNIVVLDIVVGLSFELMVGWQGTVSLTQKQTVEHSYQNASGAKSIPNLLLEQPDFYAGLERFWKTSLTVQR